MQTSLCIPGYAVSVIPLRIFLDDRHLVLEYMGGGDFLMFLLQKAPLNEGETRFYLAEMINGIDACHKLGFMHRDVKVITLI
jgi:serine/threonine protein kinase